MKYIATVGDHQYEIDINEDGEVLLDGQRLAADFMPVAEQAVYSLLLDNDSFEADITGSETGVDVLLRGRLYHVSVEDERQRLLRRVGGAEITQSGEFQLKAPMPGLIVSIPVEEGQEVNKGDILIVLESMKMQNELKAPRDGTVARVQVEEGGNVAQNTVMITLA